MRARCQREPRWVLSVLTLLLSLVGFARLTAAEDLTLTTYYPAPRGVYRELRTTNNAFLARQAGGVAIGTGVLPGASRLVVVGDPRDPSEPATCPADTEWYDENADGLPIDPGECRVTGLRVATTGTVTSTAGRIALTGVDPVAGQFWLRTGPDEGGSPISNPAGDNILGWNQTPGFAGRNLFLFGTTRIGDPVQPYTTYDLLVSGSATVGAMDAPQATLDVHGLVVPGRFPDDPAATASIAPLLVPEGAVYYNTSGALQGLRVWQGGGWKAVGGTPTGTLTPMPGWMRFPNGLLIQWGDAAAGPTSYPVPFSSPSHSVMCTAKASSTICDVTSKTAAGFNALVLGDAYWFAIGN
jgi:hypothetical protein